MTRSIRTRFAPSPTGYLHIGGVRTALFNWLFARRHGGRFVLRIDDTDQERNVSEALQPILDGFRWLGIDWDEGAEVGGDFGPYYQSERQDLYRSAVARLIEAGLAYHDYATSEELQHERDEAQSAKRRFIYSRKWMGETEEQQIAFQAEGRLPVVRLKMPREGACRFSDLVRGEMKVEWSLEQDHVIQRADGSCLYHLASVVDDHEMRISHVIRAEEHLSNTPRQIFIADGLGYERPQYAHLPFVAEPGSKNKLSKRKLEKYLKNPDFCKLYEHGCEIAATIGLEVAADSFNPVIVNFYERIGFLPEALVNYLLLLGWSLDDKTERFTRREMIDHFSLERVNKAAASFDVKKLQAFQARRMQELPLESKRAMVRPFLASAGYIETDGGSPEQDSHLDRILEGAGDRIEIAGDILTYREFFVSDDALEYDEKSVEKRLRKPTEAAPLLARFRGRLAATDSFEPDALEALVGEFIEAEGIKIGQIIHAIRVAVTGKPVGFGLYETLAILGREHCLARIDRALAMI